MHLFIFYLQSFKQEYATLDDSEEAASAHESDEGEPPAAPARQKIMKL